MAALLIEARDAAAAARLAEPDIFTNYPDDAVMPMSAVCGGLAAGQGGALAA